MSKPVGFVPITVQSLKDMLECLCEETIRSEPVEIAFFNSI